MGLLDKAKDAYSDHQDDIKSLEEKLREQREKKSEPNMNNEQQLQQ